MRIRFQDVHVRVITTTSTRAYFGRADVFGHKVLLQGGNSSLGEGEGIRGGLGHSRGAQQTNSLWEQTHLGGTARRLWRRRENRNA